MKYQFDVISIGDTTLDTFVKLDDANVLCGVNKEECWLCLNYADKIPIVQLDTTIGGNAANNAVGSARLGLKAALYTEVGADSTGQQVFETLKKEKVNDTYVKTVKGTSSNYSVVINFQAERTILVYHEKRKYQLPKLPPAKWIYYTSMGQGFEVIQPALLRYIKKNRCKVGFNPGTHQLKTGIKELGPILKVSTVLLVNKEEGKVLTGINNQKNKTMIKDLMRELWRMGPQLVVVTDGPNGAYAFDGKSYQHIGIFPVPVVEKTGAGDAFSTGCLAALIHGKSLRDALRWGTFNSGSVIGKIGPQAGLLYKNELLKLARENPKCDCKVI